MTNAREFVDNWIMENVHATGYEPEGDMTAARELAMDCWRAADIEKISRAQIEAQCGDLVEYMSAAIERVNDAEVQRLADRDG